MSNVLKPLKMFSSCQKMLRSSPRPVAHAKFNRPMFTNPNPCISEAPTHNPAVLLKNSIWRVCGSVTASWCLSAWAPGSHSRVGESGNQETLLLSKDPWDPRLEGSGQTSDTRTRGKLQPLSTGSRRMTCLSVGPGFFSFHPCFLPLHAHRRAHTLS